MRNRAWKKYCNAAAAARPRRRCATAAPPLPVKKKSARRPPEKNNRRADPPSKNSTEHCVFLSFYQVFEELRENRHQIRDLREKLRMKTYFQHCTTKFHRKYVRRRLKFDLDSRGTGLWCLGVRAYGA